VIPFPKNVENLHGVQGIPLRSACTKTVPTDASVRHKQVTKKV
jgi:hypothetical protein